MAKRFLGLVVLGILFTVAAPPIVHAHVLQSDGDIGAVLHINPDDNPAAGEPVSYILSFNDNNNRFTLADCDCTVAVKKNEQVLDRKPLNISTNNVSDNRYTFVQPGAYTLEVIGKPKKAGSFQSFKLSYAIRVSGGQSAVQPIPALLWVGMGMAIGLILLAAYAMNYTSGNKRS